MFFILYLVEAMGDDMFPGEKWPDIELCFCDLAKVVVLKKKNHFSE